jgi:preprotein translocase subunit SecA
MVLRKIASIIAGDSDARAIKRVEARIPQIRKWVEKFSQELSTEEDFHAKTAEFKDRVQHKGESLDDLLPEAFGLVAAACKKLVGTSWEVRGNELTWEIEGPYDVQLIGGMLLHEGNIAEMRTGEGKTFVCTMPLYLNALEGKGAFLVTVNDYLAHRDAEWMGGLYRFLGLSVGVIQSRTAPAVKHEAYDADITYGTNNEFGFDYLRDNMATTKENVVQRHLHYAIIDEVDSILVDEARTPLIISTQAEESTSKYMQYSTLVKSLKENEHYNIDEKQRVATLTDEGISKIESMLGVKNIYEEGGYKEIHHIEQALKAQAIFKNDVDYVVKDGEILIVDEFTGRLMPGRRYSEGLHQAIEAKEGVEIKRESKTLATVTFQNYFRLFDKLAGMTGTAKTEEEEFYKLYGLPVVVVPTNKPIARKDMDDLIFKSQKGKYIGIAKKVKELHKEGQPVLIGTVSVEKSEVLSKLLKTEGVAHNVLNAKQHEREAEIVADAGKPGAVTIATNMAGRGTDIKINAEVKELGGLYVIGTERHESRRIDNQLRGRSGRQGDPGASQFYVSMEDDLMRIFGGDRVRNMMQAMNIPEDMPISNKFVSKSIEGAQKRVEGRNFDVRKHIVEYDDVMNHHREIIYSKRRKLLFEEDIHDEILRLIKEEVESIVAGQRLPEGGHDFQEIIETVAAIYRGQNLPVVSDIDGLDEAQVVDKLQNYLLSRYEELESTLNDSSIMRQVEREVYLSTIDSFWMEHIDDMSYLRQNVALEAYGQRNPLIEYKNQAFGMFKRLQSNIDFAVVNTLFKVEIKPRLDITDEVPANAELKTNESQIESNLSGGEAPQKSADNVEKVGRNESCPCGSGKKYKKCHGA